MNAFEDSYSRIVAWLKFVLPLLALGLLSTLFLLARTLDPERAIPYAEVDVEELSRDQQVAGPSFSGVSRAGAAISMVAQSVRPLEGESERLLAKTVSGKIEFPDGWIASVTAPDAVIDTSDDRTRLEGGVVLTTSTGYRMTTATLDTALGRTDIVAENAVHAEGPPGTLDAGSMRITQDASGGNVLVFNGGVRLIYEPGRNQEQP